MRPLSIIQFLNGFLGCNNAYFEKLTLFVKSPLQTSCLQG